VGNCSERTNDDLVDVKGIEDLDDCLGVQFVTTQDVDSTGCAFLNLPTLR
jgi:hypothetical protein